MGVSHTGCGVSHGLAPGQWSSGGLWRANDLESLPYQGFALGDRVCRVDNPAIGMIRHICYAQEHYGNRRVTHFACVLFPGAGRRDGKRFNTHHHVYLTDLRHATPDQIEMATALARVKIERRAELLGFALPVEV